MKTLNLIKATITAALLSLSLGAVAGQMPVDTSESSDVNKKEVSHLNMTSGQLPEYYETDRYEQ